MTVCHNFGAGPAVLPLPVLQRVQNELLDYNGCGCSILELSHRSPQFSSIMNRAKSSLAALLKAQHDHGIIFLQGGATSQFSAIPLNFAIGKKAHYLVTGIWSQRAADEASKLGVEVTITKLTQAFMAEIKNIDFTSYAYIYYCDNETVNGIEMPVDLIDSLPFKTIPVICDMSSNILSREFALEKYALVFAGAQKNIGPAGLTIVVARNSFIEKNQLDTVIPIMMDYKTYILNDSLYNTPPTFAIYVSMLVFENLIELGGVIAAQDRNLMKSKLVNDCIEQFPEVYKANVEHKWRSTVNLTFRIISITNPLQNDQINEKKFVEDAESLGMIQLKGHRSVGGIRVSLYNAIQHESVLVLVQYMREFAHNLLKGPTR